MLDHDLTIKGLFSKVNMEIVSIAITSNVYILLLLVSSGSLILTAIWPGRRQCKDLVRVTAVIAYF